MSAIQQSVGWQRYHGPKGLFYDSQTFTANIATETGRLTVFYVLIRALCTAIAVGFIGLLVVSLAVGEPVHWAIAAVGSVGSIGLAGAVWLSKSHIAGGLVR